MEILEWFLSNVNDAEETGLGLRKNFFILAESIVDLFSILLGSQLLPTERDTDEVDRIS